MCALPLPRPLEAPLVFMQTIDGKGFRSVVGSFGIGIEAGRIRISEGGLSLGIKFVGVSKNATVVAEGATPVAVHRFTGSKAEGWLRDLQGWPAVRIRSLYDGIDLVIRAQGGRLKTDYIVAPGSDAGQIRIRYDGASRIERLINGDLAVALAGGEWREDRPVAWQTGAGDVEVGFSVHADSTVGFDVGEYDQGRELVIDPALTLSTLLGGLGTSSATAVAVDGIGDVYVAGYTDASDFPNVSPVRSRSGGVEAWVVKIRPGERRILWATCLGGMGDDRAFALALDPAGGVHVAGWTGSPDFPVVSPAQSQLSGGRDAFLLKLTTAGDQIVFSTFHGGTSVEAGLALAAYSGGVWMAGETMSADMPVAGAAQATLKGVQDGFLARFQNTGTRLSATYFGGSGEEMVRAVALDGSGRPYVAGSSESADLGLPIGAYQRTPSGGRDGFVLRFNASASAVETGTMLGGTLGSLASLETVTALAVDVSGGVLVAGYTPSADFPVVSAWQASRGGDVDGFLARIDPGFGSLTWSTYVGGLNRDTLDGIALDGARKIYVAGKSISPNFPTVSPIQAATAGNLDAVLMRFPAGGGAPDFSTYLGGTGGDGAVSMSVSAGGVAWVAGVAGALDYPQLTPVATVVQPGIHAFLSGVAFADATAPAVVSVSPSSGGGASQVFTFRYSDSSGGGYISAVQVLINATQSGNRACFISYDRSENRLALNGDTGTAWHDGTPGASTVVSNQQCELGLSGSSATVNGIYLDLSLDISFRPGFAGAKGIFTSVVNGSGLTSGWAQPGTWTVTGAGNQAPSGMTVSPASGGGARQLFTIQFTDPDGGGDFEEAGLTVGHAASAPSSCTLAFQRGVNRILLSDDDGSGWSEAAPGAGTTTSNSQCVLRSATSSFSVSGTIWTVVADLEFTSGWSGMKGIFLRSADSGGNIKDWTAAGTYRVGGTAGSAPGLSSLSPSNGSGGGVLFELSYWDAEGSNDISTVMMLVNGSHTAVNGCFIIADRRYGTVYLAADNGRDWTGAAAGQAVQLQNSQCVLKAVSSTFSYLGVTLRVRLDVAFKAAFLGSKHIWSHATDQSGRASPPLSYTGAYNVTTALAALWREGVDGQAADQATAAARWRDLPSPLTMAVAVSPKRQTHIILAWRRMGVCNSYLPVPASRRPTDSAAEPG